jgi:hypothetical protein
MASDNAESDSRIEVVTDLISESGDDRGRIGVAVGIEQGQIARVIAHRN